MSNSIKTKRSILKLTLFSILFASMIASCSKKETPTPTSNGGTTTGTTATTSTTSTTSNSGNCPNSNTTMGVLPTYVTKDTVFQTGIYTVLDYTTVNKNVKITIMPGTTFLFGEKATLVIKGIISAVGTKTCPIVFTGKNKTPGYYKCVKVESLTLNNKFENCIFEYGGTYLSDDNAPAEVQISFLGKSGASFKNCQFNHSISSGLENRVGTNLIYGLDSCSFSDNALYPIVTTWETAGSIGANNTFTNNGIPKVLLIEDQLALQSNATINKLSLPYISTKKLYLSTDRYTFTINAGAIIEMEENARFVIDAKANLRCLGTANDKIILKGAKSSPTYWQGIIFRDCATDNQINYVNFSDASPINGSYGMVDINKDAGISKVTIKNCSFSNGNNYGIGFKYPAPIISSSLFSNINGFTKQTDILKSLRDNNTFSNTTPSDIKTY